MKAKKWMAGKLCCITGATNGIGLESARILADLGAHVVIISRSRQKTERVAAQLRKETGNPHVDVLAADLSSMEQIRQAAKEFRQRYDHLDVLVNNAGEIFMQRKESVDGLEMTFALNHINYFLLTSLLLDLIKQSAPARIVNVSSVAHQWAKINFEDLQSDKKYSGFPVYGNSKLMNLYFTYELDRRIQGSGVTVNALHPGTLATNFGRSNGGIYKLLWGVLGLFLPPGKKGAETVVYLASSPDVEGVSGKYFVGRQPAASGDASYDEKAARRLWKISKEITGLTETV